MSVIEYYDKIAKEYYDKKAPMDRSSLLTYFLKYLKPNASLLDAGCGPGLDAKFFLDSGFIVEPIDGSKEMAKIASGHLNRPITRLKFEEITFVDRFDGVWTNASLIHTPPEELSELFPHFIRALKTNGHWFMSFRYGKDVEMIDGIPSYLQTEDSLSQALSQFPELSIEEIWVRPTSNPVLPNWLICIVKKNSLK